MLELSEKVERGLRTAVVYLAILALGMCAAIPGPTLLELEKIVQVEASSLSQIYLGRSIGYLVGSFLGGVFLDYCKATQMLLLSYTFVMAVTTTLIPWCRTLWLLIGVMSISGVAMGSLDTGLNVWCLYFWNDESSPFFQALHFFFGIGASLAPLIAGPFLSLENTNVTTNLLTANVTQFITDNSTTTVPPITYAYGIIGIFSLVIAAMFAFLFLIKVTETEHKETVVYQNPPLCHGITIILTSFLLLSVYAGIEIGYGQMIAVYAVKSTHKFSQFYASLIASVYWGTFTLSRGLSIFLAIKFSPITIVMSDFSVMLLAAVVLTTIGNMYSNFLWIGTALLGLGLASFYASTITWVERHINVTNKIGSSFVVAASLGEMIAPLVISQYVKEKPEVLMYIVSGCVIMCGFFILILWVVTSRIGAKKPVNETKELDFDSNESSKFPVNRYSERKDDGDCIAEIETKFE
ncbi:sodium-dependent glucose transporter 1A-like [Argiope bruennichi]|uniref:Sodium-dependent glucose transporter 1 like protein n=1 Tax=Argiope bruennichi TaxID=94029 RepID=A0A8T0FH91_ARGBR|nr:sodium-dependent glucose transporter 1A-like [Argiope bruennichi]KAF8788839.1 Sodium-dependent glucose transporter 1 like protein [Argiope bruennichi]